jgi:LEA14-like dessication related protein
MKRRYLLALALAWLSSCASLKQLTEKAVAQPKITFKSATLENATLASARFNLAFSVENPNPVGLSLAEVKYALSVEDKPVVAGAPPLGLRIPANGVGDLNFPASLNFAEFASALEAFLRKDAASYQAKGELGIATPVGMLRLPLSHEGPLTVTNRNPYLLLVQRLSGALEISGAPLVNISTEELGPLEPKGSRQISLSLAVRLSETAIAAMVRKRATEVRFTGEISSGGVSIPVQATQAVNFQP